MTTLTRTAKTGTNNRTDSQTTFGIQRRTERKAGRVNVALETQALLKDSQQLTQTEIKEQLAANFSRRSVCYANLEIPTTIKGCHDSSHFPLANINGLFCVIALLTADSAARKHILPAPPQQCALSAGRGGFKM